ncbi:hypothetical protein ACLB1G_21815 [Oxalobacteraceae bacterium A2-2]
MKLPPKGSRGRLILETLLQEPATVYQGMERHGDLGRSEFDIRKLYAELEASGCCTRSGVVYTITIAAKDALRPPPAEEAEQAPVVAPAYVGDWRAPALSAQSARRFGAAFGGQGHRV